MPAKTRIVERRSRIVCHFPMNRLPNPLKPNQIRVVHGFIKYLKKTDLTGFTTSARYENVCTGYWRANIDAPNRPETASVSVNPRSRNLGKSPGA